MTNWLDKILSKAKSAGAKLADSFKKKTIENADLWSSCPECKKMYLGKELKNNLYVCTQCDHHYKISSKDRFNIFFDSQDWQLIKTRKLAEDPNKFRTELKAYKDQLKSAKKSTGQDASLISAHGKVNGLDIVASAFNFKFIGGTLSMQSGENFYAACEYAVDNKVDGLVVFVCTGGANLMENLFSLSMLPKTVLGVQKLNEHKIPYIVVGQINLGGVAASLGSLGNFIFMEPGKASFHGFAGKRVIEQNLKEALPEDFQSPTHVITTGAIDAIVHRKDQKECISNLVAILKHKNINSNQNTSEEINSDQKAVNQ